jgi:hypothetical protein
LTFSNINICSAAIQFEVRRQEEPKSVFKQDLCALKIARNRLESKTPEIWKVLGSGIRNVDMRITAPSANEVNLHNCLGNSLLPKQVLFIFLPHTKCPVENPVLQDNPFLPILM